MMFVKTIIYQPLFLGNLLALSCFGILSLSAQAQENTASLNPSAIPTSSSASTSSAATTNPLVSPKSEIPGNIPEEISAKEGVKIASYQELLKKHFPQAQTFKEVDFLPLNNGGTSFTGLVTRLLGTGLDREYEGLRTRRFFYLALQNNTPVGVAHGSSDVVHGKQIDVFAIYTAGGTVKEVFVQGLPSQVQSDLEKGSFLKQFEGKPTEDFEVVLGRKGRIKSRGAVFKNLKYPPQSTTRAYFEKIFRCMRFNTSFMDVAFFITQHPDLADKTSADGTEEVSSAPIAESSPEHFVRGKDQGSPIDGKVSSGKNQ